jgi:hypothetical protein
LTLGESILRWSVRLCILLMLAAWMLMIHRPRSMKMESAARGIWTAGYLAFLVHLWAAFEYVHHWSHTAAVLETARRTKEFIGLIGAAASG